MYGTASVDAKLHPVSSPTIEPPEDTRNLIRISYTSTFQCLALRMRALALHAQTSINRRIPGYQLPRV
jgi:hypothetical protein